MSENINLLRKSGFWPIFLPIKFVQYNKYFWGLPHLIKTMDSKPLSLATASISVTTVLFPAAIAACMLLIAMVKYRTASIISFNEIVITNGNYSALSVTRSD